jgi:succinate-semialdehyde dehydrogenase/glutarate-semialdehyde dehydrogenase
MPSLDGFETAAAIRALDLDLAPHLVMVTAHGREDVMKRASAAGIEIEDVFRQAGFPADVFRTLLINNKTAKAVIRNKLVRAVTLTGSTAAGQSVASTAGKVLKKSVLELGGSDPYLILADADLEHAAAACATSRLIN